MIVQIKNRLIQQQMIQRKMKQLVKMNLKELYVKMLKRCKNLYTEEAAICQRQDKSKDPSFC